ncbi:MAG TPA: choice-of-anchor tandem repeat GloVer-containing protein [Candidatus Cybelea sp.]|nr:choice-of-anchor tandem repeat GloVer-containing protein [Candidatus Cybelea sp.]
MNVLRSAFCAGAAVAVLAGCGGGSTPPVRPAYSVLYSFKGGNDGRDPHAGLVNVNGTLYGTTEYGGGSCHARCFGGTVSAITTSGAETVLHSFVNRSGDGKDPRAGLIEVDGTLYGTTLVGGATCYCGTVFKVTLSGAETVLHSFAGEPDGVSPDAAVLLNVNGTLYGTTIHGGSGSCSKNGISGCGTVFSITTSGKESVLHRFAGKPDGARPYAGLINVNGTLYGTTESGGANCSSRNGCGTVFTITTSGAEKVLYSFKGGSEDGEYPTQAGLLDVNGTLYGTTEYGGTNHWGTIFSITTSGKETVLHSFGSTGDGVLPHGGLLDVNGTLYGTTSNGGTGSCLRYGDAHGCGTAFKITTSGKETVLHSFGSSGDGKYPYASLINVNGTLYGTTTAGGAKDYGTVFSIMP